LFNLAIDSKLRGCDLVRLQVDDVCAGGRVRDRATVIQKKTGRPVQFEITEQTRSSIRDWLPEVDARKGQYLFPSRFRAQPHLSTRQYARMVHTWVESAGLESSAYGTHSMRRTKAAQIYKKTGNLRAVQLLSGTRNSKARFATSASRSMTPSVSLSRSSCELSNEVTAPRKAEPRRWRFRASHQWPLPPTKRAVHHHGRKPRGWVDSCRSSRPQSAIDRTNTRVRPSSGLP